MSSIAPGRRAVLVLLALAQLMVILDVSAVNVALPSLSHDLGIARANIEWTITSYSLLFGSLLLFGGRAADLLGRRRMFLTGLGLFTAASLVAGAAPSAGALYTARAFQGIGAALLSPAALSMITTMFSDPRERSIAIGLWGAVSGAGGAIGVLLGGVLTDLIDWRAIFYVNLPIGILVATSILRLIDADAERPRWRGLDARGALVATASLAALLYALAGADTSGWTSARTLGFGAGAFAGLAAFVILELRSSRPLLRIGRLADRAIGGGFTLMLIASSVLFGSFLLISIYLQDVLGSSPLQTGLEFLPIALAAGLGAHAGSHLVRQRGVRLPIAVAFGLGGAGALMLSGAGLHGSYFADVLPGIVVTGLGIGMVMVGTATAVLTRAGHDDAGMLSGLNNTGHEVGGALGLATLATIAAGSAGTGGIDNAFTAAAGIAGAGVVLALLVLPAAKRFLPQLRESSVPVSMH